MAQFSPADITRAGPRPMSVMEETAMMFPRAGAVKEGKVFESFSFRGDRSVRDCNVRFVFGRFQWVSIVTRFQTPLRSSQCFPLERCSLGICVEQTAQDIMYGGMDYSMIPDDDLENAKDTAPPDPRYPHMLKYPETSAPEDCLYVLKWGGMPGGGKVDFEVRSKRKTGIVGFSIAKETVSYAWLARRGLT